MARRKGRIRKARSSPRRRWRRFRKGKAPMSLLKTGVAVGITVNAVSKGIENTGASLSDPSSWGRVIEHPMNFLDGLLGETVGYKPMSGSFDAAPLIRNVLMMGSAWAGSWLATRMGINAQMRRIPLIGKYVKL